MKRMIRLLILAVVCLGPQSANAIPVTMEGTSYSPWVVAYGDWGNGSSEASDVGVAKVRDEAGGIYPLISVEKRIGTPIGTFTPMDLTWKTQADFGVSDIQAGAIRNMMGFYNSGARDGVQSAALQMAIYEVLSDSAWNVSSGLFKVTGAGSWDDDWEFIIDPAATNTLLTAINVMLASASNSAQGDNIILKFVHLVDSYDFTPALSYAVTPIPGAIWLLGSGLAGLAAWRRKAVAMTAES